MQPIDPFNYVTQVQSPLANALNAFTQTKGAAQQQADNETIRQREGLLFQQAQADRAAGQQAAAQKAQAAAVARAELKALTDNPNTRASDYVNFTLKNPQFAASLKDGIANLEAGEKEALMRNSGQIYAALSGGSVDIAEQMMTDRIEAMESSGRAQEAETARGMLNLIQNNPDAAKTAMGLSLAAIDENFAENFSTLEDQRRLTDAEPWVMSEQADAIKQRAADLGKTKADTNKVLADIRKVNADTANAVLDYETAKLNPGGATDKDRFDIEKKLRDEYTKFTTGLNESRVTFDRLKNSADGSGPGDAALIFSFMKMLDPGSVVRESEFAIAQNTSGLRERLEVQLQKVRAGELLSETQRQEFVNLAGKYMEGAEKDAQVEFDRLKPIADNYGLNETNVFGPAAVGKDIAGDAVAAIGVPVASAPTELTPDEQAAELLRSLGGN